MKAVKAVLVAVCLAITLWVAVSFLEVVSTNMDPEPTTSRWNYFQLLGKEEA